MAECNGRKERIQSEDIDKKLEVKFENAKKEVSELIVCDNPYEACEQSNGLIISTEWNEFKDLDLARISELMGAKIILDMRNLLDSEIAKSKGFNYMGLGS